jgi:hypothetical protein
MFSVSSLKIQILHKSTLNVDQIRNFTLEADYWDNGHIHYVLLSEPRSESIFLTIGQNLDAAYPAILKTFSLHFPETIWKVFPMKRDMYKFKNQTDIVLLSLMGTQSTGFSAGIIEVDSQNQKSYEYD